MIRTAIAFLLVGALLAVEYDPKPDQLVLYKWTTTQSAQWKSAGDDLRYDTSIVWDLGLRCVAVDGVRMTLAATFIKVHATHRGPGTEIVVDSASGAGVDDALLGHLIVLVGKTLTLDVERSSGRVASVGGAEEVIAAVNRRSPASVPGDPPPLDAQAKAAYGPDALARLWSQILVLPGGGNEAEVALPAPFSAGALKRTWSGLTWNVVQPEGKAPAFELSKDPSPVRGTVSKLSGTGTIAVAAGLPATASGKLTFSLAIEAMTQPVTTENEIGWTLEVR